METKNSDKWSREDDNNIKFFHVQTKVRRFKNRIVELWENDNWITDEDELGQITFKYFDELFKLNNSSDFTDALDGIQLTISFDMNEALMEPVIEEEIRTSIFLMNLKKTPGLEGMTGIFFQNFWSVI